MNRILILLLLAFTISSTSLAQPSKGKKKTTAAKVKVAAKKTVQQKEEEGLIRIAVAKAISTMQRTVEEAKLKMLSDSTAIDTSGQFTNKPYEPQGWVNDFTNLFTLAQQTELDSLISAFEKTTTVEIAIVTIDSTDTNKEDFDKYVTALGNRWGVGKKEKNNGIIIGICPGFRLIRISTGKGIMAQLTDREVKMIIDNTIIPQYKQGNYFEGTKQGLQAVMQELQPSK